MRPLDNPEPRLLGGASGLTIPPAAPLLFPEQLRRQSLQRPNKIAIGDEGGSLTYAELQQAVEAVAGALLDAGLVKGDRVATALRPSLSHAVLILGCMAAGLIPCTLNIRLTGAELRRFLAPIQPALIVADPDNEAIVTDVGAPVTVLREANARASVRERMQPLWSANPRVATLIETDLALIIPTGGTTGVPKGAVSTHRGVYLWLTSCCLNEGRSVRDVELFFSAFFHISIVTGWMTTLFTGGTVRILRAFDVEKSLQAIAEGATHLIGAATMYSALRRHPGFASVDRSRVRSISVGAMAVTRDFIHEMIADYPTARLKHTYGATEFGPVAALLHEDFTAGDIEGVGYAHAGCRILVVDEDRRPLPAGEVGELAVTCPWQTVGYWGLEAETASTYTDVGVCLGDLGTIDADGRIRIVGRRKEMIISGGENVFPLEVEAVLSGHPSVQDITVYGAKDDYWGERVEAAVVVRPGMTLSAEELVAFGRASLGGYKLPKVVRFVDAIPLTGNNKPDRRALTQAANGRGEP